MSTICNNCDNTIVSTDYKATDEYCSACMLVDAEEVIKLLLQNGRDCKEAVDLAFEYDKNYNS